LFRGEVGHSIIIKSLNKGALMAEGIMLINPPVNLDRRIVQPLGIASIAAELRKAGYSNMSIVDGCYLAEKYGYKRSFEIIKEEIKRKRPFIVGCTLNNSTLLETAKICQYAFEINSRVILGGHAATACHELTAKTYHAAALSANSSSITAVVRGEGEKTALELTDALFQGRDLHGIKGITFFEGKKLFVNPARELTDINTLEPPAIDLLPQSSEYNNWINIEESRGCIFKCSFCSIQSIYPVFRLKNPERIKAEVERAKKLGGEKIYLTGELLLLDKDRALAVSDIMKGYGLKWSISAHPSLIYQARDILPVLKKSGLICIETGIEAASQRSLNVFNKGTTTKKNREVVKILENSGVPAWLHLIPFHPYMNMRDLQANITFMSRNLANFLTRDDYPHSLTHAWIPAEGTPLFDCASSDNLLIRSGGEKYVRYQDHRVIEAKNSYDAFFIKKYLKEYDPLHRDVMKAIEKMGMEEINRRQEFMLIETLPVFALFVSYSCAMAGIPARKPIESLVKRFFDAIQIGNIDASGEEILDSVLEEINEEKDRH
jgi:anaerobic magnesium-protoporphyrin IX monomethyl ester cyclase